jgi:hypothetical protein
MILLSVTGLFKTGLIILGVIFLLRMVGKVAQARRNVADQDSMKKQEAAASRLRQDSNKNLGKTTITKVGKGKLKDSEYTDFEEIKD